MNPNYHQFLERKKIIDKPTGFEPSDDFSDILFDFQSDAVRWGCRRGRAAFFEDCGLGKTPQQLVWADQVCRETSGDVLILAPLGVTRQTKREGDKFGIDVNLATCADDVKPGINVTNYEKLHKFNLTRFKGLALDESSILKSYDGATRTEIIESSQAIPYRSAYTATPAPNDYMELGNHAEFLGVMSRVEMLATFFVHDGGDTAKWRLKGHAETEFWRWLCSWAINIRKPSDLGYDDGAFKLPELKLLSHTVENNQQLEGYLFALPASTLQERRNARRDSRGERAQLAADLAMSNKDQWVLWCNLNAEAEELVKLTGFEEIAGATSEEERERITLGFLDGTIRGVITKPSIWGFGMNLQCCHNTALVGLSDSYEQFYQVLRRFWRFGQTKPVTAHIITSTLEGAVLANIKRKEKDAERMAAEMVNHMAALSRIEIQGTRRQTISYEPKQTMTLPEWIYETN